jgi:hypothetical protein
MYNLTIVESGSGDEYVLGMYDSLAECSAELEALHERWAAWDWDAGVPAADDPVLYYEGCDAYAVDEDGVTYAEDGAGGWENEETGEVIAD